MSGRKIAITFLAALAFPLGELAAAVSPAADELFTIFGLPVTNSMATSWIVAIIIIIAVRLMVGRATLVPSRGQAVIENMLSGLRGMVEPIIGHKAVGAAMPFVLAFFIYILIQNWSGLLPGVGTIGWGYEDAEGHAHLTKSFIRPANADWNTTIALALVAMAAWLFIVLKYAGLGVLFKDLFGNKASKTEVGIAIWTMLIPVFLLVGLIEVVSIAIRPLTLSVRLFGNVYGGENLLHAMGFFPAFYFLELLVGLVQALVFVLLFSVYIGLICNHDEGDEHH